MCTLNIKKENANMRKYDLSKIMRRVWEFVRSAKMNISSALKRAWKEAKEMAEEAKK